LTAAEPGVRVLDFGISKIQDSELAGLTLAGALMGTPEYMSPEQVRGSDAVSAASDVYSLGVTLVETISGETPFRDNHLGALLDAHVSKPPPDVRERNPKTPPALAEQVAACLQKEPARRPGARELARALASIADSLAAPPGVAIAGTPSTRHDRTEQA